MLQPYSLVPQTPPPYPASLLIARAFNLADIVAKDFEVTSGDEGNDGLFLLNELLALKTADLGLIPYFKRIEFPLVQGQEKYFIPNLLQVETFTFNIGVVRFPTARASRHQYFGDGRVDNIQSLPFEWHVERTYGGVNFYVYYQPDSNYIAKITGKFGLEFVNLNTNIALVYDPFYIAYLRYALAQYICNEYDIEFPAEKLKTLKEMEHKLKWVSPPDFTQRKNRLLNRQTGYSWAHVNISPGWNVN